MRERHHAGRLVRQDQVTGLRGILDIKRHFGGIHNAGATPTVAPHATP